MQVKKKIMKINCLKSMNIDHALIKYKRNVRVIKYKISKSPVLKHTNTTEEKFKIVMKSEFLLRRESKI